VLGRRWVLDASAGLHTENAETLPTLDRRENNPVGANRRLSYQSIRVKIAATNPETGSTGGANDVSLKVGPYAYSGETSGNRQSVKASLEGSYLKHTPKFGVEFEPSDFDQDLKYGWGTGISLEWADATQPDAIQQQQQVGIRRCWGDGQGNCLD